MSSKGFSLLELLLVLTVLGIMLALGVNSLISYQRSVLLREAATQLATDLNEARNQSRRLSQNWEIVLATDKKSYSFGPASGTKISRALTAPLVFGVDTNTTKVEFLAPYGVINAANRTLQLEGFDRKVYVNVVGVTGKVVVKNEKD